MAGNVLEANDTNFQEEVLGGEGLVLVDFWAPWCAPCNILGPVVEEFANENAGKVKVCRLNTDENIGTAQNYGIMSIPTLIVFKGGEKVDQFVGAMTKGQLIARMEKYLGRLTQQG